MRANGNYEDVWEGLDEEWPERARTIRRHPFANPPSLRKESRPRKDDKIFTVRRYVNLEAAQRIDAISKAAIAGGSHKPIDNRASNDYGMSLMTARLARQIYGDYYHEPNNPQLSLDRFNEKVMDYMDTDTDLNTTTTA